MLRNLLAAGAVAVAAAGGLGASASAESGLADPVRIEADGSPIDVDTGHAAPFHVDFDGDGKQDLLVGQFGEGKLRIYLNTGTDQKPSFARHQWFKAGAETGTIPAS